MVSALLTILASAAGVAAHAVLQDPSPRETGDQQVALCGSAFTKKMAADAAAPIEDGIEAADADMDCNPYLCKGYQYDDNVENVHNFTSGQVVPFFVDIVAAHKPGWANVSVVDLSTNTVIGEPLKSWDVYPDDVSGGGDDVEFNITIPDTLASRCTKGGECAIQWFWYSTSNSQTYESCVDFYILGENDTSSSCKAKRLD